jgi:hypothetical protein
MKLMDQETNFNNSIESRLASGEWDSLIARNVIRKRRRIVARNSVIGSVASMALAASLVLAILPGITSGNRGGDELNRFVSAQVEGTWNSVFSGSPLPQNGEQALAGTQDDAGLDTLIDDTLAQRF